MSEPASLDSLLSELEKTVATLAEGSAPLDELVAAHQRAVRLLAQAQSSFAELKERADQATGGLNQ